MVLATTSVTGSVESDFIVSLFGSSRTRTNPIEVSIDQKNEGGGSLSDYPLGL